MKFSANRVKQALGEVQSTLHWSVEISSPASAVGAISEDLIIRVTTSGVPQETAEDIQVEIGGHVINYTGKVTKNGELAWNFVEGTDAAVLEYFTKWINARWSADGSDTQGKQALTSEVKADLKISLLGPNDEVTRTYEIIGAMPKFEDNAELAQTADVVNGVVTWTYDDFHRGAGSAVTW